MGKSNKNKNTKKKLGNKKGGNISLYSRAQMVQSLGCRTFRVNPQPDSNFDKCECIGMDNKKIDEFEYPKGLFTCSTTDGLKMIESPANPLYRTYKKANEKTFFTKSSELSMMVETEFQDLMDKNMEVSQDAARFVIDYLLDPREHKHRISYDLLVPENMQVLMNNIQAILDNVSMLANNPDLKFNHIIKLLGKLIDKLQKQYKQLKEVEKTHGELLEKMELLQAEDVAELKMIKVNANRTNKPKYAGLFKEGRFDLRATIIDNLKRFFRVQDLKYLDSRLRDFVDIVLSELPRLLMKSYNSSELQKKMKEESTFVERKIVELLFEKDLNSDLRIISKLNLNHITKLMKIFIKHYIEVRLEGTDKVSTLYDESFLRDIGVDTSEDWKDSIKTTLREERDNPDYKGLPKMFIITEIILENLSPEDE